MKKRWSLAVVAAALLFLSACGEDADTYYDEYSDYEYTYEIEYNEATGGGTAPVSEFARRWAADIEQLRGHVLSFHPYFAHPDFASTAASIVTRQIFNAQIDALLYELPYFGEFEIVVALQRVMAIFRSNDLRLGTFLAQMSDAFMVLFSVLGDGVYLVASGESAAHALNSRLAGVNGVLIEDIIEMSRWLLGSYNLSSAQHLAAARLPSPQFFAALGIGHDDVVVYNFVGRDGVAFDLVKDISRVSDWRHEMQGWEAWLSLRANDDTFYVDQAPLSPIWHDLMEEQNILYLRVQNNTFEPIPGYNTIRALLRSGELYGTIIDMRSTAYWSEPISAVVLRVLEDAGRYTPPDMLFVLIDESTQMLELVLYLESLGATLVGTPPLLPLQHLTTAFTRVGEHLAYHAILNYSRVSLFMPNRVVQTNLHGVTRDFPDGVILPHVWVGWTIDDWYYNRDPWMDYVMEQIR